VDDRGFALPIKCSRCAAEYPPQAGPFITCTRCGLSIDLRSASRAAARPAVAGLAIATTPGPVDEPTPGEPVTNELVLVTATGAFQTSAMGYKAAPYPMAGAGSCAVTERFLIVRGFRPRSGLLRAAIVLGGLVLAGVAGWALSLTGLSDKVVVGVPMGLFVISVMAPLPPSRLAARFRIPIENVKSVALVRRVRGLASGTVMLVVKGTVPAGEIRFVTDDPEQLCRRLNEVRGRGD
jgi:hypothetical protein